MKEREIQVFCFWNGSMKYGPDGLYYEGSSPGVIKAKRDTKLSKLLDKLYLLTGFDKKRSKFRITGRYPSVVRQCMVKYVGLPVVNDKRLELMLDIPIIHPSITNVELYLDVKEATPSCLLSSSWFDDEDFRVGLCFKDSAELKKAVDWCSIKERHYCKVQETDEEETCTFTCIKWKCKWSLCAARTEEHGLFEITKYTGPHTCCPEEPSEVGSEFEADEIERAVRVQPTLSAAELKKWWKVKSGYRVNVVEMEEIKREAVKKIYGDWDHCFRSLPKLMAALQSSNGLVVDWRYNVFPNPEFASFRGVFWAFSQSIEGFQHCRPLIVLDCKDLNGKYPMKLMIAVGVDAANNYFPLAFAVTKEASSDSWRWFLNKIRDKVTQRRGLCVISSPHRDIVSVINEPGSRWKEPWAYHRFCLNHFCSQFHDVFQDIYLKNLVNQAGSTSREKEFDAYMKNIEKNNPEARRWLEKISPHKWALAHDSGRRRYGMVTVETLGPLTNKFYFHGLTMTGALLLLFDELRSSFDKYFSSSSGSLIRGDVYTEPVKEMVEGLLKNPATYVITPLQGNTFKVAGKEDWGIVKLNDETCTCGKFQAYKFPCLHALAVCDKLKINPLQYVDDCYTIERCQKTYTAKFNPVPELSAWPEALGVPTLFPPVIAASPPKVTRKARSKTNRGTCKKRRVGS